MRRSRPLVLSLSVLVVLALAGAGLVIATSSRSGPGAAAARTVDVPADRPTRVDVDDHWTVEIPAGGAGPVPATLSVTPVAGLRAAGATSMAAAQLSLSTGQPALPWTVSYRLDAPLPADRLLYLVDDSGDGAAYGVPGTTVPADHVDPARVHAATMSADRTVGTVTIDHLSFKDWVTGGLEDLQRSVGAVFGQRADPSPTCTGKPPKWMSSVVYEPGPNAPMLVCAESEGETAILSVTNNRGSVLLLGSPAAPTDVGIHGMWDKWADWPADVLSSAAAALGITGGGPGPTFLVPPGQTLQLKFTQESLNSTADPMPITGTYTSQGIVLGLVAQSVGQALVDVSPWWAYGVLMVCGQSFDVDPKATGSDLTLAATRMATCALERSDVIGTTLRGAVPAPLMSRIAPEVLQTASKAKAGLGTLVAVAEATYVITDITQTAAMYPKGTTIAVSHDVDGPMLVDDQGRAVPEPAATAIRATYRALRSGDLAALRAVYSPASDGEPWSAIEAGLRQTSVRGGLVGALRRHPGIGEDVAYNYSAGAYSLGFTTRGSLSYVAGGPTATTTTSSAADPYGCLAADVALDAGRIDYSQHPCASHFQNQADPSEMSPDTPATRWSLCHRTPGATDAPYLVAGRARYCH